MQHYDNNKFLIEQNLEKLVADLCIGCRLGIADWDFNESLKSAIHASKQTKKVKDTQKKYNDTIELAKKSNIQLESKYNLFYNPQ